MLNNIISLIVCLTELYICYDFFNAFLLKRTTFSNRLYIVLLTASIGLFHFCINSFHLTFLNMVAFPLIIFTYITIIFLSSLKKKLIYIAFFCTIFYGCDFLFAILLSIPSYLTNKCPQCDGFIIHSMVYICTGDVKISCMHNFQTVFH